MTGVVGKVLMGERCWKCPPRWENSDTVFGRRSRKVTQLVRGRGEIQSEQKELYV